MNKEELILPLIPLRELVAFPATIIPILVGRERSINAFKTAAESNNGLLFLSVQTNQLTEAPRPTEICKIGVIARIEKSLEQDNGSFRVVIHGLERARLDSFVNHPAHFMVKVEPVEEIIEKNRNYLELSRNLIAIFEEYITIKKVRMHGIIAKLESNKVSEITDIIISMINIPLRLKQQLLEELNVHTRAVKVFNILKKELFKLQATKEESRKNKEVGQAGESDEYRKKIETVGLPDYVKKRADEEIERLEMMPPFSAESTVSRYYLDWLLSIPWTALKDENNDIKRASQILDEDHYGLRKVKERILDYLAVRQLVKKPAGEIICFVGPPGVGKSSLSKSIARALGRPFVRVSLGGVRDEAEIRGHRRTYIGSYPGQIIKGLKKAKYRNPVFLLDEIDKLNSDFRGDPASALLETLDPEQNAEFVDHYLDLEINLSQVFFITTANHLDPIPPALKDRMEVIELPGYTEREKLHISRDFLIKKQAEKNGLSLTDFAISDELILEIINHYTLEAGVRNLERQIGIVLRKIARHFVSNGESHEQKREKFVLTQESLHQFLGIPRFNKSQMLDHGEVGVSIGLAWTVAGGDILVIESRFLKGKGELILTGRLGEIMKESSSTAFSYAKIKLSELDFDTDEVEKYNIHVHIPEGSVPKEGPSAGVTLAVSIISLLTGIPVKAGYAMTGEITLRGRILPVGGIKEKIIAAHRYGIRDVLIPSENEKDFLEDIPGDIKESMQVHLVDNMNDLLAIALEKPLKLKNVESEVIRPFMNTGIQ